MFRKAGMGLASGTQGTHGLQHAVPHHALYNHQERILNKGVHPYAIVQLGCSFKGFQFALERHVPELGLFRGPIATG